MARISIEERIEDLEAASPSSLENFANTDLTFDAARLHDTAGYDLFISTDGATLAETILYMSSAGMAVGSVNGLLLLGNVRFAHNTVTANYVATKSDYILNCFNTIKIDLPSAAVGGGVTYVIKNSGTGVITVDGDGTETIDGATTQVLNQYDSITVVSDGTNWIII